MGSVSPLQPLRPTLSVYRTIPRSDCVDPTSLGTLSIRHPFPLPLSAAISDHRVFTNKNTTPPPPKKEKKRKEKAPRTIIIMSLHYEWLIRHLFQSDPFFPLSSKFCFHSRLCWNLPASCTYFFWIQYLALKSHLASQELPVQLDYFSWLPVSAPSLFAILPACGTRLQGLPSILFLETPHLPLLTNLWPLRTMQIVGLFPWPVLIMPSFI